MRKTIIYTFILSMSLFVTVSCSSVSDSRVSDLNFLPTDTNSTYTEPSEESVARNANKYSGPDLYSYEGRRYNLNIPQDIMDKMSTSALLQAVLDNPRLGEIYAFDTIGGGFTAFRDHFNGVDELLKREDCVETVLERYKLEKVLDLTESEYAFLLESNSWIDSLLTLDTLELILAQQDLIENVDEDTKYEIFGAVIDKNEERLKNPRAYEHSPFSCYTFGQALARYYLSDILDEFREIKSQRSDHPVTVNIVSPDGLSVEVVTF